MRDEVNTQNCSVESRFPSCRANRLGSGGKGHWVIYYNCSSVWTQAEKCRLTAGGQRTGGWVKMCKVRVMSRERYVHELEEKNWVCVVPERLKAVKVRMRWTRKHNNTAYLQLRCVTIGPHMKLLTPESSVCHRLTFCFQRNSSSARHSSPTPSHPRRTEATQPFVTPFIVGR